MPNLVEPQTAVAIRLMEEYLSARPENDAVVAPIVEFADLDVRRRALITTRLYPLVVKFLADEISIGDFKPAIDSINKQNELWGFKGIKGQMFFNMIFNAAQDLGELTVELQAAIAVPTTDEMAKSRIRTFTSYVRRLGDEVVEQGGNNYSRPKVGSIPFFLSYFWQIQQPDQWSVYYTNSVEILRDLNLLEPEGDLAEAYEKYQALHLSLQSLFAKTSGKHFTLYDVEHVWWYAARRKNVVAAQSTGESIAEAVSHSRSDASLTGALLLESYVPPIVAALPILAANGAQTQDEIRGTGIGVARALEKSVNAAFTILGYDTKLLGQGAGRAPDGIASAEDESYAILWDAKARQGGYRMGTDDRTIREYVLAHSRELKRRRHVRNLYYIIVSSNFQDEFDDLIRGLKMETDVSEVCLVEADVLVAMVDARLRDPRQFSLGPDGIQRLFCQSGIITAQSVRDYLP